MKNYIDSMKKYPLCEFEVLVILTIGILNNEAYSVAIKDEIEEWLSRTVCMGALHTAFIRMKDKGYFKSYAREATEEREGRQKSYFKITTMGKKAILYVRNTRDEFWLAIPKTLMQANLQSD